MRDYLLAVLFGIVEGVTEFLPVSSTAHIRLAQDLLDVPMDDPFWKIFAIIIQLGAVLCIPLHFFDRFVKFVSTFPRGEGGNRSALNHPLSLVVLAAVVTAGPAYLLDRKIGENLESLTIIAAALIIGGMLMWAIDSAHTKVTTESIEQMRFWQAMIIGAAQIVAAAFPGTSRSFATIVAGETVGLTRPAAVEFSFFLAVPIMFGASLLKLAQVFFTAANDPNWHVQMTPHLWAVLATGFITSFLVAWAVVCWFMHWVHRHGFVPFAVYRILLGLGIFGWLALQ
ncbi:MAG TPA: undecaprenyl-diphosphate phosphatase [Tepidisphaeraceae bacterium]|nr:undecaprenyl-diphosphate phosphatase [Tepidisphaeraceae bacterium]